MGAGGAAVSGIVEFLRARYEERRALALAATAGPWTAEIEFYEPRKPLVQISTGSAPVSLPGYFGVRPVAELEGNGDGGVLTAADAEYIAANGPDAALADLDAKLAVLTVYEDAERSLAATGTGTPPYDLMTGATNTMRHALRFLAVPFAAHPDYDEKWRP
ncbi:DUF6221 family protein [Streptomyces sp. NPDC004610]|uniref:DUF6221 family protein n=1 Tax=unclassified Streptomyces TaxID=2593676 RepID=UPI0033AA15EA